MRSVVVLVSAHTRTAAPVAAVGLVVDLDDALAGCGNNAARVEHHAGNGVVVGIGVVDGASPKIPDLCFISMQEGTVAG
jgi:hypothetical protein